MTNSLKLYHNPDSSKSRAALALLEENDIEFETIYYLDHPPNKEEIRALAVKLGLNLKQLLRRNEATFEQFDLDDEELSEEIVLDIVSEHPILNRNRQFVKSCLRCQSKHLLLTGGKTWNFCVALRLR